jgi:hypothetical protein
MENNQATKDRNGTRTAKGAPPIGRTDQHQVDIGTYQIYQGTNVTGELLVEVDPNDPTNVKRRIEHWGLYSTFTMPSERDTDVSLRLVFTEMSYGGSAEDFKEHLSGISGVRYIKATCVEELL